MGRPMMPRPMNPTVWLIQPPGGFTSERPAISRPQTVSTWGYRGSRKFQGRATALRFLTPDVLDEPVETESLERFRQRLAGLLIEADLAVPRADHLVPLLADRLPLGRTVDG